VVPLFGHVAFAVVGLDDPSQLYNHGHRNDIKQTVPKLKEIRKRYKNYEDVSHFGVASDVKRSIS
jgi:hypothetical protein